MKLILSIISLVLLAVTPGLGQVPTINSIGPEEYVSSMGMERPSVAADSKGQPHFVCDAGGNANFMKFDKVNGRWSGGIFATGSRGGRYNASRLYIGQIEIDGKDRAWISCKFGVKEFGSMMGQGVWCFRNVATMPYPPEQFFRSVNVYKGMGCVSTDAKYPDEGVVMGTFGNWEKLNLNGQTIGRGSINAGHGGEKVRFRIASYAPRFGGGSGSYADGIWHTAMCGSRAITASYQNSARYKAGQGPIPWAAYSVYPIMGDDYHHPGVGIDATDPRMAYMAIVFYNKMCINIWDGTKMLFNPADLKVLDYGASFEPRQAPAITPAPDGGAFFFWTSSGRIKMAYVSKKGAVGTTHDITAGRSAGATTDRYGNLHLVYFNGGIKYRQIKVSTLLPIEPKNRVTGSRTPRFRWTNTRSDVYTLELTRDGVKLPLMGIKDNVWQPKSDLAVGVYSWRVKEGWPTGNDKWSKNLAFQIPPTLPTPIAPHTRYPSEPVKPVFTWTNSDPEVNQYVIELFGGHESLGSLAVAGKVGGLTAKWKTALPAGSYSWHIKSKRMRTGYTIASEWSPLMDFQVVVPGPCTFTKPARLELFDPGWQTIVCAWTESEGATSYKLEVLFNGNLLDTLNGLTSTRYQLSKAFQPGYYSLLVKPVSPSGKGPWSPIRTFIIRRQMSPGNGQTLASPPKGFEWTRSKDATRYLAKLSLYDKKERKYKLVKEKWVSQPKFGTPLWTPSFHFKNGAYRWAITDYTRKKQGYTSVDYFQVRVPGAPALLAPDGAAAGLRNLAFSWSDPSSFAEEFQIQVWMNGDQVKKTAWLPAIDLVDEKKLTFEKLYSFPDDCDGSACFWRVRGRNGWGAGPWKQTAFALNALSAPTFTEPEDGTMVEADTPMTFSWSPVPNAERYEIQIAQGDTVAAAQIISDTSWLWTPSPGTYAVSLRAGETGWSRWTTQTFSAIAP